jgi:hypothetical protein
MRQGATSVFNVPSGKAHQRQQKTSDPRKAGAILKTALDSVTTAHRNLLVRAGKLASVCPKGLLNGGEGDAAILKLRAQIGKKLVAEYKEAIAIHDQAIESAKSINGTVKLSGKAAQGSEAMLQQFGLTDANAVTLVGKLRERRAFLYDQQTLMQCWAALCTAGLAQIHSCATDDTLDKLDEALKLEPSQRSSEQNELVKNEAATRAEALAAGKDKIREAIEEFEACVDALGSMELRNVQLPDEKTDVEVLMNAYLNLLELRKYEVDEEVLPSFDQAYCAATEANCTARQQDAGTKQEGEHLDAALKLVDGCVQQGMATIDHLDELIRLAGQALGSGLGIPPEDEDDIKRDRNELAEAASGIFRKIYALQNEALSLSSKPTLHLYNRKLRDDLELIQSVLARASCIHDACAAGLKGEKSDDAVPERLLHEVLKTLPEQYEDGVRQLTYLASKFEKNGKGIPGNKALVACLKALADGTAKMMELAESQLAAVEASDKANQGTPAEAAEWLGTTLPAQTGHQSGGGLEFAAAVDDETVVDDLFDSDDASDTGASAEAVAPEKAKEHKLRDKAIKAAEKAETDASTLSALAQWKTDSDTHSGNAREGAKEGAGLRYVEGEMKLAVGSELKLAAKKTQMAKKFERALQRMEADDPRREPFRERCDVLLADAAQHETKGRALLQEGERLAIELSKEHAPTHSLFHFHCDKGQIESVALGQQRMELDVLDKEGKARRNPRTNEPLKDYIDEYAITLKGGKRYVAHFHYRDREADRKDFTACHFKTWKQRRKGMQYVMKEARAGRTVELHRARTNLETLVRLQEFIPPGRPS